MALDRKKLQKKKARQLQKAKKRRLKATGNQLSASKGRHAQIASGLNGPLHECWVAENLFEENIGIGNVVVSRKTELGVLASVFMLDVFCLGVKNTFIRDITLFEYEDLLDRLRENAPLAPIEPACARKLVESAVAYARQIGFSPQKDYRLSGKILGDIDASECTRAYSFGSDGKPMYIAGPNDSPGKVKRILRTLEKHCGQGGYDYISPAF